MKKRQAKKNKKKIIGSLAVITGGWYHSFNEGTVVEVLGYDDTFPESVVCLGLNEGYDQVVDIPHIKIIRHGGK